MTEKLIARLAIYMPALAFLLLSVVHNGFSTLSLIGALMGIGFWVFPIILIWLIARLTHSRYFIITFYTIISLINILFFQFYLSDKLTPDGSLGFVFIVYQAGIFIGTVISLFIIKYKHIQKIGSISFLISGLSLLSIFSLNQLFTLIA